MAFDESLVLRMQQETTRGDEVQRLLDVLLKEVTDPACGGLAQIRYALGDVLVARLASEAGVSVGTAARIDSPRWLRTGAGGSSGCGRRPSSMAR